MQTGTHPQSTLLSEQFGMDEMELDCPYCGERITVLVDSSVAEQEYVEDCEVCCRPMVINTLATAAGIEVSARSEDA